MILTPHILIGVAIGYRFENYFVIFGLSFLSHFALDAIPHWEYQIANTQKNIRLNKTKLRSELHKIKKNGTQLTKFHKIFADLIFGILLAIVSIYFITGQMPNLLFVATGIFGSLFPDGFSLLYFNYDFGYTESFTVCHFWIHCSQILGFFSGLIINILVYIAFVLILII